MNVPNARARALDPALSSNVVIEARRQMEDAAFQRDRLQVAVTKLRERLVEVGADEQDAERKQLYDRVAAERDQLAAELVELYPEFARKLGKLLPRIVGNDREIDYINSCLPRGHDRLLGAELIARKMAGYVNNGIATPRVTDELRLPAFEYGADPRYLWPPMR
jgi:hypothetical protein